jgi:hypothetical protein
MDVSSRVSAVLDSRALLREPKAFRFTYALVSAGPERLRFTFPRGRLLIVACVALALGAPLLLHPEWFRDQPRLLVLLAGTSGVFIFLALTTMVATHRGQLVVDATRRTVRLDFDAPFHHVRWIRPFAAFERIETRQIKDAHGLHNHWQIELVADDETRIRVGHGLIGTVRASARDRLTRQLAVMLQVPVEQREA